MRVAIADIRRDDLDRVENELQAGDRLLALQSDISTPAGNEQLAGAVAAQFGGVNLVCLNAGIGRLKPLMDTSIDEWRLQVAVNLDGAFYGAKAFLPMLEHRYPTHSAH